MEFKEINEITGIELHALKEKWEEEAIVNYRIQFEAGVDICTEEMLERIKTGKSKEKHFVSIEEAENMAKEALAGLTMTEAVALSKDKDKETKRMIARIYEEAVEEFKNYLIKATLVGGDTAVHVRVISEAAKQHLKEKG